MKLHSIMTLALTCLVAFWINVSVSAQSDSKDDDNSTGGVAEQEPQSKDQDSEGASAEEPTTGEQDEPSGEGEDQLNYEVPTGDDVTLDELHDFLEGLNGFRPTSRQELMEHMMKMQKALGATYRAAIEIGDRDGDTTHPLYVNAKLQQKVRELVGAQDEDEKSQTVDEMVELLGSMEETEEPYLEEGVMQLAMFFKRGNDSQEFRVASMKKLLGLLEDSDEKTQSMLAGMIRGIDVVGKQFELTGTRLDGEAFDIDELEGKVVLVDFWATWCGPCVAEMPNILENYERYHELGFEVVGVSLDAEAETAQKFAEKREIPWIMLNDGQENEAAQHYGISGIPALFLIDQQGVVVTTNCRGPALRAELAKLLGEVEDEPETDDESGEASEAEGDDATAEAAAAVEAAAKDAAEAAMEAADKAANDAADAAADAVRNALEGAAAE